jgi:hypothetical protein
MIEKDQPQRDPAEQVEPQIAAGGDHGGMHTRDISHRHDAGDPNAPSFDRATTSSRRSQANRRGSPRGRPDRSFATVPAFRAACHRAALRADWLAPTVGCMRATVLRADDFCVPLQFQPI